MEFQEGVERRLGGRTDCQVGKGWRKPESAYSEVGYLVVNSLLLRNLVSCEPYST